MGLHPSTLLTKLIIYTKLIYIFVEDVVVPFVLDRKGVKMGEYHRFWSSMVYAYWFILLCLLIKRHTDVHAQTCFAMNY